MASILAVVQCSTQLLTRIIMSGKLAEAKDTLEGSAKPGMGLKDASAANRGVLQSMIEKEKQNEDVRRHS